MTIVKPLYLGCLVLMLSVTTKAYAVWPPSTSMAESFPVSNAASSFILGVAVGVVGTLILKKRQGG